MSKETTQPVHTNKIYNESCIDTMSRMPDNFIDLTVTSPPYDNLRTYNNDIDKAWGEHIWKPILEELYRVTKEGGVVVWIVGDATINGSETGTSFKQALYAIECGFNLHDTMIWVKNNPMPQIYKKRYTNCFEYMFVLSKVNVKTHNGIKQPCKTAGLNASGLKKFSKNTQKRNASKIKINKRKIKDNAWFYSVGLHHTSSDRIVFKHSAPFPEKLAHDHIISWSNEGDLVYDPFMGSGTTAKMAKSNKRNYIGSEISEEYVKLAEKRISQMPETLF